MQLQVAPDIDLDLQIHLSVGASCSDEVGSTETGRYEVVGPARQYGMLFSACAKTGTADIVMDISDDEANELVIFGLLSPLSAVTIPVEVRQCAGIPKQAVKFAFAYPAQFAWAKPAPDGSSGVRDCPGHAERIEQKLEAVNLADEVWAYFLLVGGFVFFDIEANLIGLNALTLVPSDCVMHFDGPHKPNREALSSLKESKRMLEVTLDALQEAKFSAFGWAHGREMPGGHSLNVDDAIEYEHGGFVYEIQGSAPTFFQLVAHTAEQLADFRHTETYGTERYGKEQEDGSQQADAERSKHAHGLTRSLTLPGVLSSGQPAELLKRLNTQRLHIQRETAAMNQITSEAGSSTEVKIKRRRLYVWVRLLTVVWATLPVVVFLASLAYAHSGAFQFFAALVRYGVFVFVAWVPMRDTAALSILAHSKERVRWFNSLQLATPLVMAALSWLSSGGAIKRRWSNLIGTTRNAAQIPDLTSPCFLLSPLSLALAELSAVGASSSAVEVLGQIIVYLFLPLTLYYLRLKASSDLEAQKQGHIEKVAIAEMDKIRNANLIKPGSEGTASTPKTVRSAVSPCHTSAPPSPPSPPSSLSSPSPPSQPLSPPEKQKPRRNSAIGGVGRGQLMSALSMGIQSRPPRAATVGMALGRGQLARTSTGAFSARGAQVAPASAASVAKRPWEALDEAEMPKFQAAAKLQAEMPKFQAAAKLQARVRMKAARRKFVAKIADRQHRLRFFDRRIFLATLVDIIGSTVLDDLCLSGDLGPVWYVASLGFALPGILVVAHDLRKPHSGPNARPRFSIGHAIFYVAVLYRLSTKAARVDGYVLQKLSEGLSPYRNVTRVEGDFGTWIPTNLITSDWVDIVVPTLTMVCHLAIFIVVTSLGKATLNVVATPNACSHLLFPFQFFDTFFSLRSSDQDISVAWTVQQVLLQINTIMRIPQCQNPSRAHFMALVGSNRARVMLSKAERRHTWGNILTWIGNSGTTDGLVKRYGACLCCRQHKVSLRGNDVNSDPLLRLQYLARIAWQYDLADVSALVAVPFIVSFFVWRNGYFTLQYSGVLVISCHLRNVWVRFAILLVIKPVSGWIARCILSARMRRTMLGKRTLHGTSPIAAKIMTERGMVRGTNPDNKVIEIFAKEFVEEEMEAVKEEISIANLNPQILQLKLLRKWRYFVCVIMLQLFAAFPCQWSTPDFGNLPNKGGTVDVADVPFVPLHISAVWAYLPLHVAQLAYQEIDPNISCISGDKHRGWPIPNWYPHFTVTRANSTLMITFP